MKNVVYGTFREGDGAKLFRKKQLRYLQSKNGIALERERETGGAIFSPSSRAQKKRAATAAIGFYTGHC